MAGSSRGSVVQLYSGILNGVEITCAMGDVTDADTDAIVVSCDGTFNLNAGLGKAVSRAGGPQFQKALHGAIHGSHGPHPTTGTTDVLVVAGSGALKTRHVILVPLRSFHKHHMDRAYHVAIEKAVQLNVRSVSIPAIGTGSFGLSFEDAANCVVGALVSVSNFGALKKIQFIDISSFSMLSFADVFKEFLGSDNTPSSSSGSSAANGGNKYFAVVSREELLELADKAQENKEEPDACPVCLCELTQEPAAVANGAPKPEDEIVRLKTCKHLFHRQCIDMAFKTKKQCPTCMTWYDTLIGNQPIGSKMHVSTMAGSVPGHPDANGFHVIEYVVPSGIQTSEHLRPGTPFSGTRRVAYLPNNPAGTEMLKLLKVAFERRLIFTVGDSVTSGAKNTAVWNNIHHKTHIHGGPESYGYPDPDYLDRLRDELASVGVRIDNIDS